VLITAVLLIKNTAWSQTELLPPHIATDIKAERIKFSSDSIKITWKMSRQYTGDFIVGRSEKEISAPEDALQAKLIGIFNSTLDGILIDRDVQQGKKYYYIILAKELLLKRQIDVYKNINYTGDPISLFIEPESVQSLRVDVSGENKIIINWKRIRGNGIKYNVYRSRSAISSGGELEVAEKIATTEKDEFSDENIPDYGSYFYAVTITDKNGIEYFNPKSEQNYTSNGIYLKGKSLATPLNVDAYTGDKNSIIVKWEKSESRTGKDLQGYEIYRSDEVINSLLKLKFSKLIKIADSNTTVYTDKDLLPGKYYYAVFSRYSDGTVDINFDTDSNYTKSLLMITLPYKINALNHEIRDKEIILRWNYTGNSGNDTVNIFRSAEIPSDSSSIMNDDIIGTENIKAGKFTISNPAAGNFYYGILCRNENEIVQIRKGVNLTANPIESASDLITEKTGKKESLSEHDAYDSNLSNSGLDNIIRNTYYKGNYPLALKELKNFMKTTDNKYDQSKAKLFLAKSYIEMHEYEKSIRLLDNDDVKNAFPEETKFWFEFALVRLK
jgi:hypothetical protein